MKTIIYTNKNYKKEDKFTLLTKGILALIVSIAGLCFNSKLILKLFVYIFPIGLIIYSLTILRKCLYCFSKNKKEAVSFLIKGIIPLLIAIYIIFNPINTLSLIITIIGSIILINALWSFLILGYLPIAQIIIAILCISFSNAIINTFYNLFLIFVFIYGLYKVFEFIRLNKN